MTDAIAFPYTPRVVIDDLPRSEIGWKQRPVHHIRGLCVHRCSVAEDPKDVAAWFIKNKGWTSHPYHFQINLENGDPIVYQTNRLVDITNGIFGYNGRGVHVMVHGDFRYEKPEDKLFYAAACLCADLSGFGLGDTVKGHSERSLSLSKRYHTDKVCPGKQFDMEALRATVRRIFRGNETGLPVLPCSEPWWRV